MCLYDDDFKPLSFGLLTKGKSMISLLPSKHAAVKHGNNPQRPMRHSPSKFFPNVDLETGRKTGTALGDVAKVCLGAGAPGREMWAALVANGIEVSRRLYFPAIRGVLQDQSQASNLYTSPAAAPIVDAGQVGKHKNVEGGKMCMMI
jgi:hypothetical protein